VLCIGVNYHDHVSEFRDAAPEQPALFLRNPGSLVGPTDPISAPSASETFDYEGELAVVIGKAGRRISREDAADHVLGYTCFMDGSVRAFQKHSVTAGKNFWHSGAIGPWIVTRDEISEIGSIGLQTRIDGELVQQTTLDLMIFDVPALIAYCSTWTELQPGDVISTGTPAGVGAFRQPPRWLRAGERVEVSIDGVGILSNVVEADS
jgi:2-keto-4-pentenoate hydratase/2-oxohepta-3-ene-1,7-dioic acid hydratase in catechol pathway